MDNEDNSIGMKRVSMMCVVWVMQPNDRAFSQMVAPVVDDVTTGFNGMIVGIYVQYS